MMKFFLLALIAGFGASLHAQQQYDMNYASFRDFIREEMSDEEFRSVDAYFEGHIEGLVCTYEYGDFSGDDEDELVILTSEPTFDHSRKINVYIFTSRPNGKFEFVDKLTYSYWKDRYEVAILIRRGVLFITNASSDYSEWTWNLYRIKDEKLDFLRKEVYN